MSRVILQPSGNAGARHHYIDTILNPVPLARIQPFLTTEEFRDLQLIYPNGVCYIWGVTSGGSNETKWNRIERGDITLFSRDGAIYASGVTTFKLHNRNLAIELWNVNDENETWEYIYFLEEIKRQHIPYLDFNRSVIKLNGDPYDDDYVIQGFNVLYERQCQLLLTRYDLESEVFLPEVAPNEFANLVNQLDNLAETERQITTTRRLEQGFLKDHLFGRSILGICACCHKELPVSYLVTAHIKKRSHCTPTEKRDLNVVMPMCKFGCDELFEKGYIKVQGGLFIRSGKNPTTVELENYIEQIVGNNCQYFNPQTEEYFNWHFVHHG